MINQNNLINRQIKLKSRPIGEPKLSDFQFEESPIPIPKQGEILVRNIYLSLDPFIRGRMSNEKSYAKPMEIGNIMIGIALGKVIKSLSPEYKEGDWISSYHIGWQDYAIITPDQAIPIINDLPKPSYALGILGMPGFTGYMGLLDIGKPKASETLVVAAATGPVGSMVGQIGKIKGCYVVGIAGNENKCQYAVDVLGFDHCINHKSPFFEEELKQVTPNGIDIYFENVGGKIFDAVLPRLNTSARIPLCGLISGYNATNLPKGEDRLSLLTATILKKRLTIRGFIIFDDYGNHFPAFQQEVSQWIKEDKIHYKEEIIKNLENAPEAFIGLLNGKNFGKLIIQVGETS